MKVDLIDELDFEYVDERWCPACKKDTRQGFTNGGHERDSSQDRFTCFECGKSGIGIDGFEVYS